MTKDEFIDKIAKKMNCSLPEADERLSAIIEAIQDVWKTDSELTLLDLENLVLLNSSPHGV